MSCKLFYIQEINSSSRAALSLKNVWVSENPSGGSDALMGRWLHEKERWSLLDDNSAMLCSEGVDVWYTPARTAPVRLLVEAEASPAFLRRARVWAQRTACTEQGGGKKRGAEEEEKTLEDEDREKRHKEGKRHEKKAPTGLFAQRKTVSLTVSRRFQHSKTLTASTTATSITHTHTQQTRETSWKQAVKETQGGQLLVQIFSTFWQRCKNSLILGKSRKSTLLKSVWMKVGPDI